MKKKIVSICIMLFLLLTACGGTNDPAKESTSVSSATSEAPQNDASKIEELEDGSKFSDFDGETQLAIVFATLNGIVLIYDYGIGDAEAQLKAEMTPDEIATMKQSVDSMTAQLDKLKKSSDETLAQLNQFKEKTKAENEIASLKQTQQDFFDVSQQILTVLSQVTPENAGTSKAMVEALKVQYLAKAEGIMTATKNIIQVAGLDEDKFMNLAIYIIDNVAKE